MSAPPLARTGRHDFRLFLLGQSTSVFGSTLTAAAIAIIAVVTLHEKAAGVSHIVAAGLIPTLVLGPFCGVLLDRVSRPRRVLILADLTAGFAVGTSFVLAATGQLHVAVLVALAFVLGIVEVTVESLYFSHLRTLALPDLAVARGRLQSSEMGTRSVAGALAGAAVAALGAATLFLVDTVTYFFSAVCLLSLRAPDHRAPQQQETSGFVGQLRDGVTVIRQHRLLSAFVGFLLISSAAEAGVLALRAIYLLDTLHLPLILFTVPSVAASLLGAGGAVLAPRVLARTTPGSLLVASMLGAAVSGGLLVVAGGPLPVLLALLVGGTAVPVLFGSIGNLALVTVLSQDVGDSYFARVTTLLGSAATASGLAGTLLAGLAATVLDVRLAICCCVAVNLAGAVFLAVSTRKRPAADAATYEPELVLTGGVV